MLWPHRGDKYTHRLFLCSLSIYNNIASFIFLKPCLFCLPMVLKIVLIINTMGYIICSFILIVFYYITFFSKNYFCLLLLVFWGVYMCARTLMLKSEDSLQELVLDMFIGLFFINKNSGVGCQGKNLNGQRSGKEVISDLLSLLFLHPKRPRPSLNSAILIPVSLSI